MTRYETIWANAVRDAAFYRKNPHLLARDYLHLDLRLFQRILLILMNYCFIFVFVAARGLGKTFLTAIFCVIRCILWPGTKIVIASGTKGQAIQVLEKVQLELEPLSKELQLEIDHKKSKINNTDAIIVFKNGSFMKVVSATDNARSNRANLLLVDEFRMVKKTTIDKVLRKFLTQKRMPKYEELSKEERKKMQSRELNKTIYLTSAFFADHWSYEKCVDTFKSMLDPRRNNFICGLPYQIGLKEALIDSDEIVEEMLESDFNEVDFSMENCAIFYGNKNDSFFDFQSVSKNRKIKYPMLPGELSVLLKDDQAIRIPPKQLGEKRLLSADIALMASTKHKNDATAIHITQLMPTKAGRYSVNLVYTEVNEGMRTDDEALRIRRLFDEYDCDYLVLDAQNMGLPIYDTLAVDISDPDSGEIYPALSCCNNAALADRCKIPGAPKVVWAVQGSAAFNSECALLLREAFRSGRIRLLENEYDGNENMTAIKGFSTLSMEEQTALKMPYLNTTLLINELINLRHETVGNNVKLTEKHGMRKDRYSSLSYNYYVATQMEKELRKHDVAASLQDCSSFVFRAPQIYRKGR